MLGFPEDDACALAREYGVDVLLQEDAHDRALSDLKTHVSKCEGLWQVGQPDDSNLILLWLHWLGAVSLM